MSRHRRSGWVWRKPGYRLLAVTVGLFVSSLQIPVSLPVRLAVALLQNVELSGGRDVCRGK